MTHRTSDSDGPSQDLTFNLFIQLITTSYESLAIALGPENAKKAMRPYFENSGKAGYHNIVAALDISESEKLLKIWLWGNHAVTKSCIKGAIGPNKVMLENYQCPFEGKIPEFCNGYCQTGAEAAAREVWPECNFSQIPADDTNDHRCRWVAFIVPDRAEPGRAVIQKEASAVLKELPPHQFDWLAHAISGEVWVIATRAMLDSIDQEQAASIILQRMSKSGAEFAERHYKASGPGAIDVTSLVAFVESINKAQQQKGRIISSEPDKVVMEIHECPYSDSPDLLCREYEAFLNGACARIDPNYEFKYEQMMTHGDQYCIWNISRKEDRSPLGQDVTKKGGDEGHPLMILMRRLARGEISIKEYEELKAFITSELKETKE
jgi:hypothetical protein